MREVHRFEYKPETDEEFAAFQVVHDLFKAGYQAYIVGGAVRDRYMTSTSPPMPPLNRSKPSSRRPLP